MTHCDDVIVSLLPLLVVVIGSSLKIIKNNINGYFYYYHRHHYYIFYHHQRCYQYRNYFFLISSFITYGIRPTQGCGKQIVIAFFAAGIFVHADKCTHAHTYLYCKIRYVRFLSFAIYIRISHFLAIMLIYFHGRAVRLVIF